MLPQAVTQETRKLRVVFHDQHAHEAKIAPPPPVIWESGASGPAVA
jgi:hypothetical protein